jgi:hypothetical protein
MKKIEGRKFRDTFPLTTKKKEKNCACQQVLYVLKITTSSYCSTSVKGLEIETIARDIDTKKLFQISILGDSLDLQYEPPKCLKIF